MAYIAQEDYEGLDLGEASARKAAKVKLYRPDRPEDEAVAFDLLPTDARPYVGSSGSNSALSLGLGYNGLGRLTSAIASRSRSITTSC